MSHQQQLDPTEVAKVQRDIKLLYVAAATFSSIGFYMTFYLPNLYKLVGVTVLVIAIFGCGRIMNRDQEVRGIIRLYAEGEETTSSNTNTDTRAIKVFTQRSSTSSQETSTRSRATSSASQQNIPIILPFSTAPVSTNNRLTIVPTKIFFQALNVEMKHVTVLPQRFFNDMRLIKKSIDIENFCLAKINKMRSEVALGQVSIKILGVTSTTCTEHSHQIDLPKAVEMQELKHGNEDLRSVAKSLALEETLVTGKTAKSSDVLGNFVIVENFIKNPDGSIRYPTLKEIINSAIELMLISDQSLTIEAISKQNLIRNSVLSDQARRMSCAFAVGIVGNYIRTACVFDNSHYKSSPVPYQHGSKVGSKCQEISINFVGLCKNDNQNSFKLPILIHADLIRRINEFSIVDYDDFFHNNHPKSEEQQKEQDNVEEKQGKKDKKEEGREEPNKRKEDEKRTKDEEKKNKRNNRNKSENPLSFLKKKKDKKIYEDSQRKRERKKRDEDKKRNDEDGKKNEDEDKEEKNRLSFLRRNIRKLNLSIK